MTEVTLEFIGKQLERVLAEQAAFRDELLVVNARMGYLERSMERLEAAVVLLTAEVRAFRNQVTRMNDRLVKLEDAS
jgi:septal ring factor EnvC (AmiA/AmiB activator)